VLGGRYELLDVIGAGGMGKVWRAKDRELGRIVAVKVLPAESARDPEFRGRFLREGRAVAALSHPAIAHVHDVGEDQSGDEPELFLVMEYAAGRPLNEMLRGGQPLPIATALGIAARIAVALEHSHEQGVVHRDVKPSNVIVTPSGDVKVLDFGIAKLLTDQATQITATGRMVGTPAYISPEQARGGPVDARTDQYSLGCLLYQALTGRVPFSGDSVFAVLGQHLTTPPAPPSSLVPGGLPAAVEAVVLRLMAKEAGDRFPTMAAARRALEAGPGTPETGTGRRRLLRYGLGVGVTAAAVGAGWGGWRILGPGDGNADDGSGSSETPGVPGLRPWQASVDFDDPMRPLLSGAVVLAADHDLPGVYAFDAPDGARRWESRDVIGGSGMTAHDGVVYAGGDGDGILHALDLSTGEPTGWRFDTGGEDGYVMSPAVLGDVVCLRRRSGEGDADDVLFGVDREAGTQRWQMLVSQDAPDFVADGGGLFVASGTEVYSVDPAGGDTRWSFRAPADVLYIQRSGSRVYVVADEGRLIVLDGDEGERLLTVTADEGEDEEISQFVESGDTVYVGASPARVRAVNWRTGETRWQTPLQAQEASVYAVADGVVYVATYQETGEVEYTVTALDAASGVRRWSLRRGEIVRPWAVAGGLAYCSSSREGVLALDAATGEERWKRRMTTSVRLTLAGNALFVAGEEELLALEAATGRGPA
jgi:outer membrane protein assembly factor BamB